MGEFLFPHPDYIRGVLCLCGAENLLSLGNGIVNGSDIEECLFGKIVHFAIKNHVESAYYLLDGNHHSRYAGKLFGYGEGLAEETLYASCTVYNQTVIVRKFVHTENGNDILQFLIFLKNLLHALCTFVVLLTDDVGVKDT